MRTQTLIGLGVMNYPEQVVFLNDRNVIEIMSIDLPRSPVGGTFNLSNGNDTIQLSYNSERDTLTFDLYSVLKKLAGDNNVEVTVSGAVTIGQNTTNITPFILYTSHGRTLHSHSHNAERIIYYYNYTELYNMEILSINGGTVGLFPVTPGVNKLNLGYHSGDFDVTIVDGTTTRVVHFKETAAGGDNNVVGAGCNADDDDDGNNGTSSDVAYIELMYINTDGCRRYVKGKVINRKRSVTRTQWRHNELIRNTPNAMLTDHTDEITLGCPGCERLAYTDDIMYSPQVWYVNADGVWTPCEISSKSLQLDNWDVNDIQITIKTLA